MVVYKQADSEIELHRILQLQQQNLSKNLSVPTMQTQGFVTVEHDFGLLKKMNDAFPHTLAKDGNTLAGYALSMHPSFNNEIEVLKPMFDQIHQLPQIDCPFMVMGQVCVAEAYRGQGIFRGLYQNMLRFIQPQFEAIITEVDVRNTRSMHAHKAIGFTELVRYFADGREWSLIILG